MLSEKNYTFQSRIKQATKELLGQTASGRSLTVLRTDTYITSYPKSGNTWVRFLIANMLFPDGSTDFMNINNRVPDIYTSSDRDLLALAEPRYLKSHEYFDPRYPKVLYIVRDVRSVLVSYFHHLKLVGRIENDANIAEFAVQFMEGKVDKYGSWNENVLSWLRVRADDPASFLMLRYEDLRTHPSDCCNKIGEFLGQVLQEREIENIVELSKFERMKSLELAGIDPNSINTAKKTEDRPVGFVRSGKTQDWKLSLDSDTLEMVYQRCGTLLEELGYEV